MEEMYLSKEDKIYLDEEFHIIENERKFPYMIFYSLTADFFMSKYEDDIAKVNDYIFFNNQNLENILNEKIEKLEEAKNTDIYKGYKYEGIMARESEMFEWEWVIKSLNKSNNIVLLLSFLEGALKEICNFVEKEKRIKERSVPKKGDSKFKFYLKRISICCDYEIESKIRKHIQIINKAKSIRNIFVHEWDAYYNRESNHKWEKDLKEFKINKLIDSISKILYVCEYAMLKANILQKEKDVIGKGLLAERQLRIFYQIQDETESDDFNLFSEILEIY